LAVCTSVCTSEPPKRRKRGADAASVGGVETPAEVKLKPVDAELSKVIDAWPTLPVHLKAAVMALVATVQNSSR
jgi:hypothetical protein